MQIHKIQATPRNNINKNKSANVVATAEEEDEFWEVPSDYPNHLLKRKPTKVPPKTNTITTKQNNNTTNTKPATKLTNLKQNATNIKNTKNIISYAQPQPPIQKHTHTTTKLHIVNGDNGKRIIEKKRVPIITNQPPLNENTNNTKNYKNKNVIITNEFLTHADKMQNKEYQHSRYADNSNGFSNTNVHGAGTETFSINDAIQAAVSSFENSPHPQYFPHPSRPLSSFSSFPSSSSPHPDNHLIHPPPSSSFSFPNHQNFDPHSHPSSDLHFYQHRPRPPSSAPLSTNDLIEEDVDYEEEMLKQRAIKLQEDMDRLKAKKSLANFHKFEEELRIQKQREFEMVENNCKQKLESQIATLFEDKEKNMREYKLFQLDLEEKINQLLKIQADLNYKISTLENSYVDCVESYKRDCYELIQREQARIEDEFALQVLDWKQQHNID